MSCCDRSCDHSRAREQEQWNNIRKASYMDREKIDDASRLFRPAVNRSPHGRTALA